MDRLAIPYGKQNINSEDIECVVNVLKSDFITQGPQINLFEENLRNYVKSKHCLALNSATSALHVSCLALGLEKNDIVWTSSNSFVASSNCALYCNAMVDFVDIDKSTYNLCAIKLEEKLKIAKKVGNLPKIVIPVHFSGQSCDMKKIYDLSKIYNFKIIEDASHAIGGSYQDVKIGSCRYSDITVFSFHPVKIVTTGEGGAILTNNDDLYEKASRLRTHGVTKNVDLMQNKVDPWYYEQIDLGYNYRITDIQAALGVSQLKRLDNFIEKRHQIANRYNQLLKNLPLEIPHQSDNQCSAFHLYVIKLHNKNLRKSLFEYLRKSNIFINIHYIPIHTQPYYQGLGFKKGSLPICEDYYDKTLSLPIYYDLSEEDQDYIVECISNFFEKAI